MRDVFRVVVIGMIMGVAEIIPGVSGGTIAFVTGIYSRLINAVRQCNPTILMVVKNEGFKVAWSRIDGTFLLNLVLGMAIAIILFAGLLSYLLDHQSVFTWSFFFSLVLCSVWLVVKQIGKLNWQSGLLLGVGVGCGLVITNLIVLDLEPTLLSIFIGGAIAVCAWILPGLSGSFILLILGLYRFVLEAIRSFDIVFILTLAAGCAVGLMTFSQLLSRLLDAYRRETLAVLAGFMLGSLLKLWPWKFIISSILKSDGSHLPIVQYPVLPYEYQELTGLPPELTMAALGFSLGAIAVLGLNQLSRIGSDVPGA